MPEMIRLADRILVFRDGTIAGEIENTKVCGAAKEDRELGMDGALGTAEEVAELVLFLAGDRSSFIAGESIVVSDGAELGYGFRAATTIAKCSASAIDRRERSAPRQKRSSESIRR